MHVSSWLAGWVLFGSYWFSFTTGPSSRLLPGDEQDVLCVIQDTPVSVYSGFEKNSSYLFKLTSLHGYLLVDFLFSLLILEPLPHSGYSFHTAQLISPQYYDA